MTTTNKNRIYCFDLLKIISLVFVFTHHIVMDMYVTHPMHNLKIIEGLIIRPNLNLVMVACGLFVLISGATLALNKREESPLSFYKRRLTRVLIPFYIAYLIYFIIKVISNKTIFIFGGIPKWRFIFTIMGIDEYLSANGIGTFSLGVGEWFLGCIILCYLVYPFLYRAHKKNRVLTFVIMTIYYIAFNLNYHKFNFTIVSHMNFLSQIYNFYLGVLLVDEEVTSKIKEWFLIVTIPIVLFLYTHAILIPIPDNFKTTIACTALVIAFYIYEKIFSRIDVIKKFCTVIAKISLEIFLVHHFIIYQVDYMLNYRRLNGIMTLAVIIFDIVATIIIALIVEKLSSKAQTFMNKCHN